MADDLDRLAIDNMVGALRNAPVPLPRPRPDNIQPDFPNGVPLPPKMPSWSQRLPDELGIYQGLLKNHPISPETVPPEALGVNKAADMESVLPPEILRANKTLPPSYGGGKYKITTYASEPKFEDRIAQWLAKNAVQP